MAKGYEQHRERLEALAGLGRDLARRSKSKCELTGVAGVKLVAYEVPPVVGEPDLEKTLFVSERCAEVLENPKRLAGQEWRVLVEQLWAELPAVQVVAYRMLEVLAKKEDWAREALGDFYADEEVEAWAKAESL